jgi:hypothetical protein
MAVYQNAAMTSAGQDWDKKVAVVWAGAAPHLTQCGRAVTYYAEELRSRSDS